MPEYLKQEALGFRREPFIRGYGRIVNPDQELFDLHDPLPLGAHIFGTGALMGDGRSWGLVPSDEAELYRLSLIDDPKSTLFVVKNRGQIHYFRRYDGSHPRESNVVERVTRNNIPHGLRM